MKCMRVADHIWGSIGGGGVARGGGGPRPDTLSAPRCEQDVRAM